MRKHLLHLLAGGGGAHLDEGLSLRSGDVRNCALEHKCSSTPSTQPTLLTFQSRGERRLFPELQINHHLLLEMEKTDSVTLCGQKYWDLHLNVHLNRNNEQLTS